MWNEPGDGREFSHVAGPGDSHQTSDETSALTEDCRKTLLLI